MNMGKFLIRRILSAIPVLFLIIFVSFAVIRAVPGGPFDMIGDGRRVSDETIEKLNQQYGLDEPMGIQFLNYLSSLARLDFGPSLGKDTRGQMVNDIIRQGLPISMQIGLMATVLGFLFGVPLGMISAINHNTRVDFGITASAVLVASIPSLVLAPVLINIFAVRLNLVPVQDMNNVWRRTLTEPGLILTWEYISLALLPVLILATGMVAGISRLTRASLLQVLREDYIRTARSKGLRERSVIYIHAMRNGLIPVATILGPLLAGVMTGTFIIEQVFTIPGLGRALVGSVESRDYNLLVGVTIIYSVFLLAGNIMVDLLYTFLDPRIRFD